MYSEAPSFVVPEPRESVFRTENSLLDEARYLHDNWQLEGLSQDWRYLDKTGFNVKKQVDMLYKDLTLTPYVSYDQVEREWLKKTGEDMHGFVIEYLARRCVFPIRYALGEVDGETRVIAPMYGGVLMVDTVLEQERNGVVKNTLVNHIEPGLIRAQDGDIFILTSPSGWTGLFDSNGNEIIHEDSQTYILQKRGVEIMGFTIRTDFENFEHRKLIGDLSGKKIHDDAGVEEYFEKFIYLKGMPEDGFELVVNKMREIRGGIFAYKNKTWDEIYQDLSKREGLWSYDEVTQEIINEFSEVILSYDLSREEIEEVLATAILKLSRKVLEGTNKSASADLSQVHVDTAYHAKEDERFSNRGYYKNLLDEVESLVGCNGVSSEGSIFESPATKLFLSMTPRLSSSGAAEVLGSSDDYGPLDFKCPDCGENNRRPKNSFVDQCQHCGSKNVKC